MSLQSIAPLREAASPASIRERLATGGPTLVALSGGVDSAVVALLAREALGGLARAVTIGGPAVEQEEIETAKNVARAVGIAHEVVLLDPLQDPSYRENGRDRCYHCRRMETGALRRWGAEHATQSFVDGIHLDDLGDVRPGIRAMEEAGFRHPLADGGWRKATVREFAREARLPNADRPSNACLASRIRTGEPITREALERVARGERALRAMGFRQVRVRLTGSSARIEVGPEEVSRLLAPAVEREARAQLLRAGLDLVTIDPAGYRSRAGP